MNKEEQNMAARIAAMPISRQHEILAGALRYGDILCKLPNPMQAWDRFTNELLINHIIVTQTEGLEDSILPTETGEETSLIEPMLFKHTGCYIHSLYVNMEGGSDA